MTNCYNKLTLYFILILGIVAIGLWTIFLIQLNIVVEQTKAAQEQHINGSLEARKVVVEGKEISQLNVNMTKINAKNIENIMNNISEINNKISK